MDGWGKGGEKAKKGGFIGQFALGACKLLIIFGHYSKTQRGPLRFIDVTYQIIKFNSNVDLC